MTDNKMEQVAKLFNKKIGLRVCNDAYFYRKVAKGRKLKNE